MDELFDSIKADYDALVGSADVLINKRKKAMERKVTIYIRTHLDFEIEQILNGKFDDDEIRESFSLLLDNVDQYFLEGDDYVETAYVKENGKTIMVADDNGDGLEYANEANEL